MAQLPSQRQRWTPPAARLEGDRILKARAAQQRVRDAAVQAEAEAKVALAQEEKVLGEKVDDLEKTVETLIKDIPKIMPAAGGGRRTVKKILEKYYDLPNGLGSAAGNDTEDFATAAQGTKADSAVQPGDLATVAYSGSQDNMADGTTNKNYTATEKTKLADAVTNSDTSTAAMGFVLDEDDFTSNSATKLATQASTKANIDARAPKGRFSTVSAMLANTDFGYSASRFVVSVGDRIEAGGHAYDVAAAGATDHDVVWGAVKLYVVPDGNGRYSAEAFNLPTVSTIDATAVLQKAFDKLAPGLTLAIPPREFKISKGPASTDYPGGDQPCISVIGKFHCKIEAAGVVLKVHEHGQGAVEFQLCEYMDVDGLYAEGPGNFPPLDGTTGRGEKGISTAGYYHSLAGYYKNNSLDTSALSAGGYGGAFPQWGGGTASTWGAWNGGYITNFGNAILVHNGCKSMRFVRSGGSFFNGSGLKVGFLGDYYPTDRGYADCENIVAVDCIGSDNYTIGFDAAGVAGFAIRGGEAHRNGHPDALVTDTVLDPGYGFASAANSYSQAKDVLVTGLSAFDNKRKGLDAHGVNGCGLVANILKRNLAYGIDVSANTGEPLAAVRIALNDLEDCGMVGDASSCGIITQTYASAAGMDLDTVISGNTIRGGRGSAIIVGRGKNAVVESNIIKDASGATAVSAPAIQVYGTPSTVYVENIVVIDNLISGALRNAGISLSYGKNCSVRDNKVALTSATATSGILAGNYQNDGCDFIGNDVSLGAAGVPFGLYYAGGKCFGNTWKGGNAAPIIKSSVKTRLAVEEGFDFTVTFNGTASPTISNVTGTALVVTASSTVNGVQFTFTNDTGKNDLPSSSALDVRASWRIVDVPTNGSVYYDKIRARQQGVAAVELGMKETWSGASVPASSITSGKLDISVRWS